MKKCRPIQEKRFSEMTGKLHTFCPHSERSGVEVHVVIRDGTCYKSGECLVVECRYGTIQNELENLISITW